MTATFSTYGSGMARALDISPCGMWSPHEPAMSGGKVTGKPVPVRCNRPCGHSGNHMNSYPNGQRLAEWEQARVIV